jgi:hypothetical protein
LLAGEVVLMARIAEPRDFDDDFTTEHAHGMLDFYVKSLIELGYRPVRYEDIEGHIGSCRFETPKYDTLNHALWMCEQTRLFLRAGRLAKAYRWIGTIQGILLMNGVFSILELKDHNRLALPPVRPRGRR